MISFSKTNLVSTIALLGASVVVQAAPTLTEFTLDTGVTGVTTGTFSITSNTLNSIGQLTGTGNTYYYASQSFTPSATGSYTFGQSSASVDTVMILYQGSYDPDSPGTNAVSLNDDSDGVGAGGVTMGICGSNRVLCPKLTENLTAATDYFVVITTYNEGVLVSLPIGFYVFGEPVGVGGVLLYSVADALPSLVSNSQGLASTFTATNLLVNGAHSRPTIRLVAPEEKAFWIAGDFGTDNHGSRDGNVGLGEFGTGYNYGPVQLNVAIGQTWADQNLINSGDIEADGKYIMVEGIIPVNEEMGLYATLGAYNLWGELDIKRGYLNGGAQDFSKANPDNDSWGLRARVDWVNAFAVKSTNLSPYVDLYHSKTTMDAYTELGGGFPAQFDERKDEITELRIGVNSATSFGSGDLDFIANLEAVHRFDDSATNTTGQLAGIGSFNIAGADYKQNWLKAGVGVEGKVGQGNLSVMLNGTTKAEKADAWLAVSYTMAF